MTAFIAKPFDVEDAVALVRRLARPAASARIAREALRSATARERAPAAVSEDLPGIDLERGLSLWMDAGTYREMLGKFAGEFARAGHEIARLPCEEATALVHKLTGAAAAMALSDVAACAGEAEAALTSGEGIPDARDGLRRALDTALASIARYVDAPPVAATGAKARR